jgi:hypothetical protein
VNASFVDCADWRLARWMHQLHVVKGGQLKMGFGKVEGILDGADIVGPSSAFVLDDFDDIEPKVDPGVAH